MQYHKYSLSDIDGMIPWERDIYVKMLIEHLEKLKEEQEKASRR
jgi:phosphorylcholine metabolism protein LicD